MTSRGDESVFDFKIGPAFLAVIVSIFISFAQFVYSQGQQSTTNANTQKSIDLIRDSDQRRDDKISGQSERLAKVETIVNAIQSSLSSIDTKLDRLSSPVRLDKR